MAKRGHGGHAYRKLWDLLINSPEFLVCEIPGCYKPINRAIRGRQSMAPSLDMIIPFAKGGDPADPFNYRPAHYGCNARRGAGNGPQRRWIMDDSP